MLQMDDCRYIWIQFSIIYTSAKVGLRIPVFVLILEDYELGNYIFF